MSKTAERRVLGFVAAVALTAAAIHCNAQSLGDLAEAQRLKQKAEIAKLQKESAPEPMPSAVAVKVDPAEAKAASQRAIEASRPQVTLHALYARDGAWVAELAEGQRLTLALVGMKIYGQRVAGIEQRGLILFKPCTARDVREKERCGSRVVAVGGSI